MKNRAAECLARGAFRKKRVRRGACAPTQVESRKHFGNVSFLLFCRSRARRTGEGKKGGKNVSR